MKPRSYKRPQPHRRSKLIIIVTEGQHTEPKYLAPYTQEDSRIVLLAPSTTHPDNSLKGLLLRAKEARKEYELGKADELWLLFDTDRNDHALLIEQRAKAEHAGIFTAQSNPCFEVWLYYHFASSKPTHAPLTQEGWKKYLDQIRPPHITSYYQYRTHVEEAIHNSLSNFECDTNHLPLLYTTECHTLLRSIILLMEERK